MYQFSCLLGHLSTATERELLPTILKATQNIVNRITLLDHEHRALGLPHCEM